MSCTGTVSVSGSGGLDRSECCWQENSFLECEGFGQGVSVGGPCSPVEG